MLNYLEYLEEYLNLPVRFVIVLVIIMFVSQVIGEVLSLKGKLVPEIFTFRKYLARKKEERKAIRDLPKILKEIEGLKDLKETLDEFKTLVKDWNSHYDTDNISKRDVWMRNVDNRENCLEIQSNKLEEQLCVLNDKMDKISATVLNQSIEDRRNAIINFAQIVIDKNAPVTREQFNRIFKIYGEYETLIEENHETNGEVEISIQIIRESYEEHMRNHTFIEELRGYNLKV